MEQLRSFSTMIPSIIIFYDIWRSFVCFGSWAWWCKLRAWSNIEYKYVKKQFIVYADKCMNQGQNKS